MEIYRDGIYWHFKNTHGPVPKELKGDWTSRETAERALMLFRSRVQSKAINVTQKGRERRQRATSNTTISD